MLWKKYKNEKQIKRNKLNKPLRYTEIEGRSHHNMHNQQLKDKKI